MSIETLENVLNYLKVDSQYFVVNASNDVLMLTYDTGTSTAVDIPDGTYTGATLATAIQTAMNSALTMNGTVTWSSTTYKFTFNAGTGHTLTYTHTGSDAGILVGFNQSHSASLTLVSDLTSADPTAIVSVIHNGVEKWVKNYCRNNFESTSYSETYDGNGEEYIFIKHTPISSVSRIAVGTLDIVAIYNTNSYSTATVSYDGTNLILTKDGVSTELAIATYSTITTLVAAINATSGWVATIQGDYGNYASSELRKVYGLNCIDSSISYLSIPDKGLTRFNVYADEGMLQNTSLWTQGTNNIYIDYTAGYSSANMPDDLKLAIKKWCKFCYQRYKEETEGVTNYSLDGISISFEQNDYPIPTEVKAILNSYKRWLV